jgi:hypothetical protein
VTHGDAGAFAHRGFETHRKDVRKVSVTLLSCCLDMVLSTHIKEVHLDIPVFYARSLFFNVDGIPVSLGNCDSDEVPACAAWDVSPPRRFDADSARRYGAPISLRRFQAMVTDVFAGA